MKRSAFTLIELLVVIGIIAVLIGLLLPTMSVAREQSKATACLSNLRQLALATEMYCNAHHGTYPCSSYSVDGGWTTYGWDFTTTIDRTTRAKAVTAGLIFTGALAPAVEQCPSYEATTGTGSSDPFTGYNYNTSYIGREQIQATAVILPPAKAQQVMHAPLTALFADGQYAGGTDKFMRCPLDAAPDTGLTPQTRAAGTQGFRHRKMCNVAYCDGHAASVRGPFSGTTAEAPYVAVNTGFLSADNSAYWLQ